VLADLHAGALDARQSAALWAQVNRDPEAQAVLAALDAVKRDLDALGDAPAEPMPAHFAAQLDAAIAAEATKSRPTQTSVSAAPGVAPVVDMAAARRRRNRRTGWAAGVLTAAAAAVAVTFVALPSEETDGTPQPQADGTGTAQQEPGEGAPQGPLALEGDNLGPAISGLTGQDDYGPFESEQGLLDCLDQQGITNPQVAGAREVTVDGTEGVAALLAGGEDGKRFRLVIVDPQCTELITDTSLG
jgi:hypothetical protein